MLSLAKSENALFNTNLQHTIYCRIACLLLGFNIMNIILFPLNQKNFIASQGFKLSRRAAVASYPSHMKTEAKSLFVVY